MISEKQVGDSYYAPRKFDNEGIQKKLEVAAVHYVRYKELVLQNNITALSIYGGLAMYIGVLVRVAVEQTALSDKDFALLSGVSVLGCTVSYAQMKLYQEANSALNKLRLSFKKLEESVPEHDLEQLYNTNLAYKQLRDFFTTQLQQLP